MPREATLPENLVYQFLSINGDGTGETNASGDYSVTPTDFYIQPPPGEHYHIARMVIFLRGIGSNQVVADKYGSGNELSTGVRMLIEESGSIINELTGPYPVIANAEWARFDYDVENNIEGTGPNYMATRWSYFKAGTPEVETSVYLRGDLNARLIIRLNDDLSSRTSLHKFNAQGRKLKSGLVT